MKKPMRIQSLLTRETAAFLVLSAAAAIAAAVPADARFATAFEESEGYNTGNLNGVADPVLANSEKWYVIPTLSGGGSIQDYAGSRALRLQDPNSGGYSIALDIADVFDATKPFTFSFDMAVSATSAGDPESNSPYFNIRIGTDANSNSNKTWLRFSCNLDGSLTLWTNNTVGNTQIQVKVGNLADFVSAGTWLSVSITVDPVSKTYTGLTLGGDRKTGNVESIVGAALPWISTTPGDPPAILWFHTTGTPTSTSWFDNITLATVPEPASGAALAGLAGLLLATGLHLHRHRHLHRRRRRRLQP
jgi:hypothetical protein